MIVAKATMSEDLNSTLLHPQDVVHAAVVDAVLKKHIAKKISCVLDFLNTLSTQYEIVTHHGVGSVSEPSVIVWTPLLANGIVPLVIKRGQRGGRSACPSVQIMDPLTIDYLNFKMSAEAIFKIVAPAQ